jgi:hypothetical protein
MRPVITCYVSSGALVISRDGEANFCSKSANKKITSFGIIPQSKNFLRCASLYIANLLIFIINPQIANPQIPTKYCTNLFQNSPKSCLK